MNTVARVGCESYCVWLIFIPALSMPTPIYFKLKKISIFFLSRYIPMKSVLKKRKTNFELLFLEVSDFLKKK